MRKELMRFKRIWVNKYFFQSKMVLDIHKGVEDMYKAKKDEEGADLEDEVVAASTGQSVHRVKQTDRPITLTMAI
jgi:hypothetical protein